MPLTICGKEKESLLFSQQRFKVKKSESTVLVFAWAVSWTKYGIIVRYNLGAIDRHSLLHGCRCHHGKARSRQTLWMLCETSGLTAVAYTYFAYTSSGINTSFME